MHMRDYRLGTYCTVTGLAKGKAGNDSNVTTYRLNDG